MDPNPTQTNQLAGKDDQERSGVSPATIILHSTYTGSEGKMVWPFIGINKAGAGTFHLHGKDINLLLQEVEAHVKGRIREHNRLGAAEVSHAVDPKMARRRVLEFNKSQA